MKILAVEPGPLFSVHDVHVGWIEAFEELGCEIRNLNYSDRLSFYSAAGRINADSGEFVKMVDDVGAVRMASKGIEAACFEFWPDALFVTSCFYIPLDTLDVIRSRGIKIVINHLECPYEDDRQAVRAEHADINLINDPTNFDRFPAGQTEYMPAAYRPSVHHVGPADPLSSWDFVFTGTGYPSRVEFFDKVDFAGINAAFAGNWPAGNPLEALCVAPCVDNETTAAMYRSALTGANLYRVEAERPELADGWACGPREIEMAACGLWFARQARAESNDLFPMLPAFETPAELGDLIRWALANPEARQAAATAAAAAVTDRTFNRNAGRLLALLERL